MTISRMRKIVWRKMEQRGFMGDIGSYMDALLHRWKIPSPRLYRLFTRCLGLRLARPRTKHGWIARCISSNDQYQKNGGGP